MDISNAWLYLVKKYRIIRQVAINIPSYGLNQPQSIRS